MIIKNLKPILILLTLIMAIPFSTNASTIDNLVENPSFENGTKVPSNWTIVPSNWKFIERYWNLAIWDIDSHTGNRSVKIAIYDYYEKSGYLKSDLINVEPSQNYNFSAWGKVSNVSGNPPMVRIIELDINENLVQQNTLEFTNNDWTQEKISFKTSDNTVYTYIYANIRKGYGEFWIDDVSLIPTIPTPTGAKVYYVSVNGNDDNDGLSPTTPIKTIDKVNSLSLLPGDKVLFKRGDTWIRDNNDLITLSPKSGNSTYNITYSNYGNSNDPLPVLTMAIDVGSSVLWSYYGNNIWSITANADVGNLLFNNKTSVGKKQWSITNLLHQGDYYYDSSSRTVKLYSISNPGIYYDQIIAALRPNIVTGNWNTHHYVFDGIHFSMAGGQGIELGGVNNAIIRNCDFSWIGGSEQSPGMGIRFGNAIEFWNDAHDTLVEKNRIWEVYDAAMTTQGDSGAKYNQYFYNNIVWNSEYGFEFWNIGTSSDNIHIENNLFYNSGGGWAHAQRPDPRGVGFNVGDNTAITTNIYVRNNLFLEATDWLLAFENDWLSGLVLDYNGYANGMANLALFVNNGPTPTDDTYTMSQFEIWKSNTGKDAHSILNQTNNFVANPSNKDFHLMATSPAIDAGTIVNVPYDFDNNYRPRGYGYDIGAYELFKSRLIPLFGRYK